MIFLSHVFIFISSLCFLKPWCVVFTCAPLEELPVHLWEQESENPCLGYLDVKFRGQWQPVCQKEVDTEADASAAIATAKVVCRELGCGSVLEWKRILDNNRPFSFAVGGIRCSGKEEKTRDCPMGDFELCDKRGILYIICSGETD